MASYLYPVERNPPWKKLSWSYSTGKMYRFCLCADKAHDVCTKLVGTGGSTETQTLCCSKSPWTGNELVPPKKPLGGVPLYCPFAPFPLVELALPIGLYVVLPTL